MSRLLVTGMGYELAAVVDPEDGALEVSNRTICWAIGDELRHVREARGWSRLHLVSLLPSRIGERTLASYEHGARQMTIPRLVEICGGLRVDVGELVAHALQRARIHLENRAIRVDLHALVRDSTDNFGPIAQWAQNTIDLDPDGIVVLDAVTVRHLASFIGCKHGALARYLAQFFPKHDCQKEGGDT